MLLIRIRNSVQIVYIVTHGLCEIYNFMHTLSSMFKNVLSLQFCIVLFHMNENNA